MKKILPIRLLKFGRFELYLLGWENFKVRYTKPWDFTNYKGKKVGWGYPGIEYVNLGNCKVFTLVFFQFYLYNGS